MELTELSTQLKTLDVDSQISPTHFSQEKIDTCVNLNRRLTRSQVTCKTELHEYLPEHLFQKSSRKLQNTEDEITNIYLNNKVKLVHKNLETIFEDPVIKKGGVMFHGRYKCKRSLYLCREFRITSKQKNRIRKNKIRLMGRKKKFCKISDDEFRLKMMSIDTFINDEDSEGFGGISHTEMGEDRNNLKECFTENVMEGET